MANIWKVNRNVNNNAKRNNFDLSFQNHLTMKMGTLYPVFCKEVVPGDSFRINSAFGLKFMPLAFPVQSKMRAHMHFYYVRNKNLWDRWEDWLEGLKTEADGVVHPYIEQGADFFKTGSLSDYLGVPTTLASAGSVEFALPTYVKANVFTMAHSTSALGSGQFYDGSFWNGLNHDYGDGNFSTAALFGLNDNYTSDYFGPFLSVRCSPYSYHTAYWGAIYGFTDNIFVKGHTYAMTCDFKSLTFDTDDLKIILLSRQKGSTDVDDSVVRAHSTLQEVSYSDANLQFSLTNSFVDDINGIISQGDEVALFIFLNIKDFPPMVDNLSSGEPHIFYRFGNSLSYLTNSYSISDETIPCPFDNTDTTNHNKIRISALPYRAYESIYYTYYNNNILQPLRVDGNVEYNKYNTTTDGGADQTPYHLFQRNYELDFLTSALPSPQQGNAPLVGLSPLTGQITVRDPDDPTIVTTAQAVIDNDKVVGVNITSPIANKEHALTLQEIASVGMSINSFRNANALQRWLENTIRKGSYRYQDFIEAHFGVRPKYNELDMPEFIGGFSRDVQVSQIISTADTLGISGKNSGQAVGSFNGMANCFGGSNHSISHYCDDYGFIIGILCITPTPSYSQLLPKHFLKYNPLDYYFEEMSQLGMQPITYEEVCPIQAYYEATVLENGTNVRDTFGYQRPNYDLVASVDEIHGQFRKSLNSFLINRVFQSRPQLGDDFLKIDPDETNQIFIDQAPDFDNIIGQVVFDVKAKRPLPVVHMPSLGR